MEDIYQRIYGKMDRMGVFGIRQYAVIEKPPFVPLCIDRISEDCYALSQNKVIDGFTIADPDMEIRIDHIRKTAEPLAYQDRTERRVVYPQPGMVNLRVKNDLASLLDRWLDDLLSEGFIHQQ
ncbi:MAG: hypothetical protein LLF84_02205 [Methanoregulaceae archaeon]|nr:hypothetical protein [Methanoregulaceae archaeon]